MITQVSLIKSKVFRLTLLLVCILLLLLSYSCISNPYKYEPLQNSSFSELMNHTLELERRLGACQQKNSNLLVIERNK